MENDKTLVFSQLNLDCFSNFSDFSDFSGKDLLVWAKPASQLGRQPASWPANQPVDLSARRQPAATGQNLNFSLTILKKTENKMILTMKTNLFGPMASKHQCSHS